MLAGSLIVPRAVFATLPEAVRRLPCKDYSDVAVVITPPHEDDLEDLAVLIMRLAPDPSEVFEV